jgi:ubiquinone/menaquinone biosynthesis C-methylase UbiE
MKLNWIERLFVNSPIRRAMQHLEINWFQSIKPLEPGARILEIGCGRGAGAKLIFDHFKPEHLFLLDLDMAMINNAAAYLNGRYQKISSFCVGNATALPFVDGCMDAVFGFGFLHHVLTWRNSLAETSRVLRRGGIYYMEELYPSLYQNFITSRILVHPARDRFNSQQLRDAFVEVDIAMHYTFELKRFGILGIGIKTEAGAADSALRECRMQSTL